MTLTMTQRVTWGAILLDNIPDEYENIDAQVRIFFPLRKKKKSNNNMSIRDEINSFSWSVPDRTLEEREKEKELYFLEKYGK